MIVAGLNSLYLAAKRVVTNAKPITILTYHSISDNRDHYTIGPKAFARQIECVLKNYNVVRLKDIRTAFSNGKHRSVILTFDDAYRDFIEAAYPVLKGHSVPCTVFAPSGLLGKENEWDSSHRANYLKKRILSSDQLVELNSEGLVDFGSHSVDHKSMSHLSIAEMRKQALESANTLENLLDRRITMFSYPYGHFSATTTRVLLEAKYEIAVTTKWGTLNGEHNILNLKRITLREEDTESDIRAKIDGDNDIYYVRGVGFRLRSYSSRR